MAFLVSTWCTEATMQLPKKSGSLDTPANTQEEFGPDGLNGSIFGATLVSSIMCIERSTFLVLVASVYLADGKNAHCML